MTTSLLPTYAQFTAWGFTGTLKEFQSRIAPAVAAVDYCIPVTNEVDATDPDQLAAYQKAVCATAEFLITNPAQGVKAYTAGKVREELAAAETAYTVARKYLSGSGLLSMWA